MGELFRMKGGGEPHKDSNVKCELCSFFFFKLEEVSMEGVFVSFAFLYLLAPEGVARGSNPVGAAGLVTPACWTQTDTGNVRM